jgi:hypothetical protein
MKVKELRHVVIGDRLPNGTEVVDKITSNIVGDRIFDDPEAYVTVILSDGNEVNGRGNTTLTVEGK